MVERAHLERTLRPANVWARAWGGIIGRGWFIGRRGSLVPTARHTRAAGTLRRESEPRLSTSATTPAAQRSSVPNELGVIFRSSSTRR